MKAIDILNKKLDELFFDKKTNVFFVLGFPYSDIGKGTLTAHLLANTDNSDAIKFDGLFNTNANGRHTARGHDDFGIYEKYNKDKRFGDERYILGGYLFKEFIDLYGEYENLSFSPHFYKHFLIKILEIYNNIGKPKNLYIEIGGLITDFEVEPYVVNTIRYIKQRKNNCKVILLSSIDYNGKYVKTKVAQTAIKEFFSRGIIPDFLLLREPKHFPSINNQIRVENEKIIHNKILDNLLIDIKNIITIPFFDNIDNLGDYLKDRFISLLLTKPKIFLGTKNKGKIQDYKNFLQDRFEIFSPYDLNLDVKVKENSYSLIENSQNKAQIWGEKSKMITISEDTGFFIKGLNGKPGISIKTWGGEFDKELDNKSFLNVLKEKLKNLNDTSCYFLTVLSVYLPNGEVYSILHKEEGYIDLDRLENTQIEGYPLSAVFIANGRNKTWSEMTLEEQKKWEELFLNKIVVLLNKII